MQAIADVSVYILIKNESRELLTKQNYAVSEKRILLWCVKTILHGKYNKICRTVQVEFFEDSFIISLNCIDAKLHFKCSFFNGFAGTYKL